MQKKSGRGDDRRGGTELVTRRWDRQEGAMRGIRSGAEVRIEVKAKVNAIKYCKGFAKWAILAVGNFKHIHRATPGQLLLCF